MSANITSNPLKLKAKATRESPEMRQHKIINDKIIFQRKINAEGGLRT
jgi:hypothetical protein